MSKDKNPPTRMHPARRDGHSARKESSGDDGLETDVLRAPADAADRNPHQPHSQLWRKFDQLCDKRPVASAWAALPYRYEILLFAMAAAVRYYAIGYPDSVVFDEYHFGAFVGFYNTGRYFFDIHPPLGKLTLFWLGNMLGYNHSACSYSAIHEVYGEGCYYYILRNIVAFFGSMLPPCTFSIAKKLGCSDSTAFLAGSLMVFDIMHVIESRHVLVDSQLMFYCALSLWFALKYWDAVNKNLPTIRNIKQHALWLLGIGVTCSTALSIKWTTLATPGMIAVESFTALTILNKPVRFDYLVGVLGVIIALYCFWWKIHFDLLPWSGDYYDGFMPMEFQRTLINSTHYDPNAPGMNFFHLLWELNREMYESSARINTPHHWESKHYQWIGNTRGVLYWAVDDTAKFESRGQVYIFGNPAVSWLAAACVAAFAIVSLWKLRYPTVNRSPAVTKLVKAGWFCMLGYAFNLLPYLGVTRQAFCYHYMPALFYASLVTGILLQWLCPQRVLDSVIVPVLVVVMALAYIRYSPWVYAFPLPLDAHTARRWVSTWD